MAQQNVSFSELSEKELTWKILANLTQIEMMQEQIRIATDEIVTIAFEQHQFSSTYEKRAVCEDKTENFTQCMEQVSQNKSEILKLFAETEKLSKQLLVMRSKIRFVYRKNQLLELKSKPSFSFNKEAFIKFPELIRNRSGYKDFSKS